MAAFPRCVCVSVVWGHLIMYPNFQSITFKVHRESGCGRNFTEERANRLVHLLLPNVHLHVQEKVGDHPLFLVCVAPLHAAGAGRERVCVHDEGLGPTVEFFLLISRNFQISTGL